MNKDELNFEVRVLVTDKERQRGPFDDYYEGIKDNRTHAVIHARLIRLRFGNAGDWKAVGEGVFELRINYGPVYGFILQGWQYNPYPGNRRRQEVTGSGYC